MTLLASLANSPRYAEILRVLVKHGFGSFLEHAGIAGALGRGKEFFGAAPQPNVFPDRVRLRLVLEELGPNFIKLGQVLSMRPDLIPADVADEFRKLQSNCPQVAYAEIQKRLQEEFPGTFSERFRSVDPQPLAAASLAQTHRAVLEDGTPVVLKILRPGAREVIEADLEVLGTFAGFVEDQFDSLAFSPREVVREFSRQIRKELDLESEGRSADRLNAFFVDAPQIKFPKIYWNATTKNVLAMEEAQGVLLSTVNPDDYPLEQRQKAVANGTDAVFRMCLEFGFFHADPHPGNIFVAPNGMVTFIDCGMTGCIDRHTRQELGEMVKAVVDGDLERAVRAAVQLTDADPALEYDRGFRTDAWELITRYRTDQISHMDVPGMLDGMFELFRRHRVRCPGDLVYLIRALSIVQGVGKQFAPDFQLITHIRPHMEKLIRQQYTVDSAREKLVQTLVNYVELAEDLPGEIRAIAAQIRRRDFSIRLEHKGLDSLKDTVDRASRFIAVAFTMGATIVGSAILLHAQKDKDGFSLLTLVGVMSYLLAGGFTLHLLLGAFFGRHPKQ
jgi:ubiquinone biosynthesis protein